MDEMTLSEKILSNKAFHESEKGSMEIKLALIDFYTGKNANGIRDLVGAVYSAYEKFFEGHKDSADTLESAITNLDILAEDADDILGNKDGIGKVQEFYRKSMNLKSVSKYWN